MKTQGQSLRSHWPLSLLSGVAAVINMTVPLMLVRLLPVEGIAQYKTFFLYLTLIPWISISGGLLQGVYRFGSSRDGLEFIGTAWASALGLSGLMLIALLSLLPFQVEIGWTTEVTLAFALAAAASVSAPFLEESLVARGHIWQGALTQTVFEFLRVTLVLFSALLTRDARSVFYAFAAITLLKTLIGITIGTQQRWIRWAPRKEILSKVFRFAIPASLAGAFSLFAIQADVFVLTKALSPERFALYALGCLPLPFLTAFEQAVNKVLIPELAARLQSGQVPTRLLRDAVEELSSILIPAAVGLVTFAAPIIHLLFSERYASAAQFLSVYGFFYLFAVIPFDALAKARGEGTWILRSYLIAGSIGLLGSLILVPLFEEWGAMASIFAAQIVLRGQGLWHMHSKLPSHWSDLLPWGHLLRVTTLCVALAVGSSLAKPWFKNEQIWFVVMGSLFSLIYFATVLRKRWARHTPLHGRAA